MQASSEKQESRVDCTGIASAPKDERILLFVPAFGPWNASWWPGSWAWAREQWAIHTPFSGGGDRALFGVDIPQPTHWMPMPPAPEAQQPLPAHPNLRGLAAALRTQRQVDEDGTEVGVSRQAADEAAAIIETLAAGVPPG